MIEPHPTAHALVLSFDEGALSRLRERKARVAVAKRASRGGWTVVWAAWEPSGNDEIAWTERYGVFAGHTLSHDKAPIGVLACVYPAADRALYTFHGETFGPPQVEPDLARGGFDVRNASDKSASFGLVQFLTVNGESRLSATSAIEMAPMVPASLAAQHELHVWTAPGVVAGQILQHLPARALTIRFESRTTMRCTYDQMHDAFHLITEPRNSL